MQFFILVSVAERLDKLDHDAVRFKAHHLLLNRLVGLLKHPKLVRARILQYVANEFTQRVKAGEHSLFLIGCFDRLEAILDLLYALLIVTFDFWGDALIPFFEFF